MSGPAYKNSQNEELVSEAFSRQSAIFDQINAENKLTLHLRDIYRAEINRQAAKESDLLELNCGTGIDSLYFATQGYRVLATDNAAGMLARLDDKIAQQETPLRIATKKCSFSDLHLLGDRKFDYIISNFGGLNCTADLEQVLAQFDALLNPGGKVTLVLMPKVCPWELVMALKGDFKTAFRRFRKDTPAHVEGTSFACYYYNPGYVIKALKQQFTLLTLKGIYITVPPEFYQGFVERYPKCYKLLRSVDRAIADYFPFNRTCDHYLITLQKKS